MKKPDVTITYGEDDSVGKAMLREHYKKRQTLKGCNICRILYEDDLDETGECQECRNQEGLQPWR